MWLTWLIELYRLGDFSDESYRSAVAAQRVCSIYVNKNRGVLAGDLTRNIRHIDKVTTVVNDGRVYDAVAIEKALGNAPRRAAQIN
jgi:hypothetical protein